MTVLVDAGADINACDRLGFCPIHISVRNKFYKGVEYLLMAGKFYFFFLLFNIYAYFICKFALNVRC